MRTGMAGLALWSFPMASAHGAGLMLVPVLIPLCLAAAPGGELTAGGSLGIARRGRRPHARDAGRDRGDRSRGLRCVGVAVLRRGWINLDLLWTVALIATGLILFVV